MLCLLHLCLLANINKLVSKEVVMLGRIAHAAYALHLFLHIFFHSVVCVIFLSVVCTFMLPA